MKWYHILFCILCAVYCIVSVVDMLSPTNDLSTVIIWLPVGVWSSLVLVAIMTMPRKKENRRAWNYIFVFSSFLVVLLHILRIIIR